MVVSSTPVQRRKRVSEFQNRRRSASLEVTQLPQEREGPSATREETKVKSTTPAFAVDISEAQQSKGAIDGKAETPTKSTESSFNPIRRRFPGAQNQQRLQRLLVVDHKRLDHGGTVPAPGTKASGPSVIGATKTTQQHTKRDSASTETSEKVISSPSPRNNSTIREKAMRRRSGSVPKLRGMIESQKADTKTKEEQESTTITSENSSQRNNATDDKLQAAAAQRHQQQIMKVSDISVRRKNMFKKHVTGQQAVLPLPAGSSPSRKNGSAPPPSRRAAASPSRKAAAMSPSRRLSRNLSGGLTPKSERSLVLPSSFDEQSPPRFGLAKGESEFVVQTTGSNNSIISRESRRDRMKRANNFKKKTNVSVPRSNSFSETGDTDVAFLAHKNGSDAGSISETDDGSYRSSRSIRKYPKVQKEMQEHGSPLRKDQVHHPSSPLLTYRSRSPTPGSNASSPARSNNSIDDQAMHKQSHLLLPTHTESTSAYIQAKESPIRNCSPSPVSVNNGSSEADMKVSRQHRKEVVRRHQKMKAESMETTPSNTGAREHHHSDSYFISEISSQEDINDRNKPTEGNANDNTPNNDSNPYEELQREEESWAKKMSVEPSAPQTNRDASKDVEADIQVQSANQHVHLRDSSDEDEWEDFKEWAYSKPTKHKPSSYPKIDAPITMPPANPSSDGSSVGEAIELSLSEKESVSEDLVVVDANSFRIDAEKHRKEPSFADIDSSQLSGLNRGESEYEIRLDGRGSDGAITTSSGSKSNKQRERSSEIVMPRPVPDLHRSLVDQEEVEQFDYDGVKCIFDDTSSIANTVSTIGGPSATAHIGSGNIRKQMPRIHVEGLPEDFEGGNDSELPTPLASGKGPNNFIVPPPPPPPGSKKKHKKKSKKNAKSDRVNSSKGAPPPPPPSPQKKRQSSSVEQLQYAASFNTAAAGEASDHTRKIDNTSLVAASTNGEEQMVMTATDTVTNQNTSPPTKDSMTLPTSEIITAISSCSNESSPIGNDTITRVTNSTVGTTPERRGEESNEIIAAISSCSDERQPSCVSPHEESLLLSAENGSEAHSGDVLDTLGKSNASINEPPKQTIDSKTSDEFEGQSIVDAFEKRVGLSSLVENANEDILQSNAETADGKNNNDGSIGSNDHSIQGNEISRPISSFEKGVSNAESESVTSESYYTVDTERTQPIDDEAGTVDRLEGEGQSSGPSDDSCAVESNVSFHGTSSIMQGPFALTSQPRDRSMDYLMTIDSDPGPRSVPIERSESLNARPIEGSFDFAITNKNSSYIVDDVALADSNSDVDAIMEAMTSNSDEEDSNADAIIDAMTKRIADITQRLSDLDTSDNLDPSMPESETRRNIRPYLDSSEDEVENLNVEGRYLDNTVLDTPLNASQLDAVVAIENADEETCIQRVNSQLSSLEFHLSQGHLPPIAEDAASHEADLAKSFDDDFNGDDPASNAVDSEGHVTFPPAETSDSLDESKDAPLSMGFSKPDIQNSVEEDLAIIKPCIDEVGDGLDALAIEQIEDSKVEDGSRSVNDSGCDTPAVGLNDDEKTNGDAQTFETQEEENARRNGVAQPFEIHEEDALVRHAADVAGDRELDKMVSAEMCTETKGAPEHSVLKETTGERTEEILDFPLSPIEGDGSLLPTTDQDDDLIFQNVDNKILHDDAGPALCTNMDEINEMLKFPLSPINDEHVEKIEDATQIALPKGLATGTVDDSKLLASKELGSPASMDDVRALAVDYISDESKAPEEAFMSKGESTEYDETKQTARKDSNKKDSENQSTDFNKAAGSESTLLESVDLRINPLVSQLSESDKSSVPPVAGDLLFADDRDSSSSSSPHENLELELDDQSEAALEKAENDTGQSPADDVSNNAETSSSLGTDKDDHSSTTNMTQGDQTMSHQGDCKADDDQLSADDDNADQSIAACVDATVETSNQLSDSGANRQSPANLTKDAGTASHPGVSEDDADHSVVDYINAESSSQLDKDDMASSQIGGCEADGNQLSAYDYSKEVETSSQLDKGDNNIDQSPAIGVATSPSQLGDCEADRQSSPVSLTEDAKTTSHPNGSEDDADQSVADDMNNVEKSRQIGDGDTDADQLSAGVDSKDAETSSELDKDVEISSKDFNTVSNLDKDGEVDKSPASDLSISENTTIQSGTAESPTSNNAQHNCNMSEISVPSTEERNTMEKERSDTRLYSPSSHASTDRSDEDLKDILDFLSKKDDFRSPTENILSLMTEDSQDIDGSTLSVEEKMIIEQVAATAKLAGSEDRSLSSSATPKHPKSSDRLMVNHRASSEENETISKLIFASDSTWKDEEPTVDSPLGRLGFHEQQSSDSSDHSYMKFISKEPASSNTHDDLTTDNSVYSESNSAKLNRAELTDEAGDSEGHIYDGEVLQSLSSMDLSTPGKFGSGEDHLPASASKIMHDNPKMAEKIDLAISAAAARFDEQPLCAERTLSSPSRKSWNGSSSSVNEWEKTPKSKTRIDKLLIVPSEHPSPFEKLSTSSPDLIGHVLSFLGDPVAVCRFKSLNRECYHYVEQNMHTLMQAAVRLGGISMNMRPAFWMWVALEQFGEASPDLMATTSDEPTQLQHLESIGKSGKWHPVIERDVPRSFGNLPPHKTGARLRTDSIVRALVSWGKSRTMKRGVKGLTEPPSMPLAGSDNFHHDDDSDDVSLAPTDTVSEWGGVTPVGSFANASLTGDQEGEKENHELGDNRSNNADGDEMALSANTLTDATKAILQQKLSFVLHALAAAHPDVGYCQGMDYVVAHLLRLLQETVRWSAASKKLPSAIQLAPKTVVTPTMTEDEVSEIMTQIDQSLVVEETCFRMMDTFFTAYNLRHFYWPELRCLKTCCLVFERLIQIKLPVLADHFDHHELNVGLFTLGWFQTLFLYLPSMPTATVSHMWDIWLVERSFKIFFRVATAILFLSQPILLNHELEGMMSYLNTFPDATLLSPDILIACALQIKITNKLLMEIEKEVAESGKV